MYLAVSYTIAKMVSYSLSTGIQHITGYNGFSQDSIIPILEGKKLSFKYVQEAAQAAQLITELRQESQTLHCV